MATMIIEVYDALIEAGASEGKAKAAATVVLGVEQARERLATKQDLEEAKLDILKWVIGLAFAQVSLLVGILFATLRSSL